MRSSYVLHAVALRVLFRADRDLKLVPHLLNFFLRFLLRNRVFTESTTECGFCRALDVAYLALTELPLTSKMAKTMPDHFSEGCNECWGRRANGYNALALVDGLQDEIERDAKRQRVDSADAGWGRDSHQTAKLNTDMDVFEAELRAANVEVISRGKDINLVRRSSPIT
jgi:hypothetical protein